MPLIVVSDTSPIRALHHLDLMSLCRDLYETLIVPETVQAELRKRTLTCPAIEVADYPFVQVQNPGVAASQLGVPSDLDPGETQAIALAIELHADLLLMDERKGTAAARHLGLATIGVFGVLLEAKRKSLIDRVLPLVDRLVTEQHFFTSASLRRRLAELANE